MSRGTSSHQTESHQTESQQMRLTAMVISLLGGIFVLFLKFYAANLADSAALRSDALEGTVNVLAAAFGLGSLMFSEKPADADHPYGHGKIEYFAKAFEGGLISLAAVLILIDTIERLSTGHTVAAIDQGLKINLLAGLGNGIMGLGLVLVGRKYHSEILRADGIHLLTDLVTTLAMAVGLGLMIFTGWEWIDPVLAILVALFLLKTGFQLVKESSHSLLDAKNPQLIESIVGHLNELIVLPSFKNIITVHDLKAQEFGRDKHLDIHLVVPEFLSIQEAHQSADQFAQELRQRLGHQSEVHTHLDPCEKSRCATCSIEPCPIRIQPFASKQPITVASAIESVPHSR